jgi:hypothetical protein
MRFAYDEDKMELLHVHRVQDILHGLVYLESAHVKRVVFEDTDNPRLFDNLTTWELPKLFKNATGADPDQSWPVPVVRELLAQCIEEMKPRLIDDQELERQIAAVEADLRQKVCPFYRYALGAKVPRTDSAAAAPLCLPKAFTAAQVAQAPARAVQRAAALAAAKVPVSTVAPNAPWAKNNACAPNGGDATVKDQTIEASIKQEMDMAKTPEEIAADKAAKEQEAAAKKAAAAAAKAQKDAEKAAAKAAKEAEVAAAKAAKDKAKADAEAAKAANKLPEQNGITRPKPETLCGKIWAVLDGISTKNGAPASIAEAKEHPEVVGMADATIRTQYARWRKFYGVTGRVDPPKAAEPAAAPAA